MKVYKELAEAEFDSNTVLSLGTFDGIHKAHKEIINTVVQKASAQNARNFLITFYPHPRSIISPGSPVKLLSTNSEKISILDSLGVTELLIINFTGEFSKLSAEDFIINYIVKGIGVKEIVIGYDHRFGKGRTGNKETLKILGEKYNFKVTEIGECRINGETVNSTRVRKALEQGDIESANTFLGRYYSLSGKVVAGDKRGRELGFPTANIKVDGEKLLPASGIYAAEAFVDNGKYFGLLSIGRRPTFYDEGEIITEAYLYDFSRDIYGKEMNVNLIERIRGQEKFSTADELVVRMKKDKETGLEILGRINSAGIKIN